MTVAVIIPCFNNAKTLKRAVFSALRQKCITEIIIVDDRSDDASILTARECCEKESRVRLVERKINGGPGAARNQGVKEATEPYICFVDADDELIGDFPADALDLLNRNTHISTAKCDMTFFDDIKGYILPKYDPRHDAAILSSACGMLIKKEMFIKIGGFPESVEFRSLQGGEDVAFMSAVMENCQPIARIEASGYKVWSRDGSHLDRFLSQTRVTAGNSFEFVDQAESDSNNRLHEAIEDYLNIIRTKFTNMLRGS